MKLVGLENQQNILCECPLTRTSRPRRRAGSCDEDRGHGRDLEVQVIHHDGLSNRDHSGWLFKFPMIQV